MDEQILHEEDVKEVINEEIDERFEDNVVIADLVAITGGEAPTEVEYNLIVTKVNAILAALRGAGIVPTA